ncbi:MAG TPA: FtsW/RodA/SpoVE family cell cycle protein [Patescibacteria group bacterium]|nr:FtsW/RodA/SpoVE family cell cycle protein [Patescibacteria group bacterium]
MGKFFATIDWVIVLLLIYLGCFGLFLLLTVSKALFFQQLAYLFVGFLFLFLCSRIDALVIRWFAPIGYVIGILFLALSYIGPNIRGATRWIALGSAQFQPSELAKPLFLLAFTYFIIRYSPRKLQNLPLHIILFLIPFILVFKQPDLGSSIVYSCFWLAMLLAGGLPMSILLTVILCMALLLPGAWFVLLPYQKQRILTFLNPAIDPKGAGYNALQAMIAVGSGQLFGRGLGRGTQSHLRFLPEYHTDFIFASLIEELGFAGGIMVFAGYIALLFRIIQPYFRGIRQEAGIFVYSLGLFSMLLSQIFINTGMNMGLIPITGITLPFISYGGSSILSSSIAFGFLWALERGRTDESTIAIG